MAPLSITEDGFSVKQVSKYKLSISIGVDSFRYCIVSGMDRLMAVHEIPYSKHWQYAAQGSSYTSVPTTATLRPILKSEKLLHMPYKEVIIAYEFPIAITAPLDIDIPTHIDSLRKILPINSDAQVLGISDKGQNLQVITAVQQELIELLQFFFPNSVHVHKWNALLRLYQVLSNDRPTILGVELRHNKLWLTVFKNDSWQLINQYDYQSTEDILYYIRLATDRFKVDLAQAQILLSGSTGLDNADQKLLREHLHDAQVLSGDAFLMLGETMSALNTSEMMDLLSIELCV